MVRAVIVIGLVFATVFFATKGAEIQEGGDEVGSIEYWAGAIICAFLGLFVAFGARR